MTQPKQNVSAAVKLLMVEGPEDKRFFSALCKHLEIDSIKIDSYNGKDNLKKALAEKVKSPGFGAFSSLGIVRDADNSANSAFESVKSSLIRAELPTPSAQAQVAQENGLRVSVLILPPEEETGELENVCLKSIENSSEMKCVESYFTCLGNLDPTIDQNQMAKARLHSYLAPGPIRMTRGSRPSRGQPALRIGEAAEAGVWDWSSPAFDKLADFLRSL